MLKFITRRVMLMIPTMIVISILSFALIQLPPGDFLTSYVANLMAQGDLIDQSAIDALRERYGLGQPMYVQYWKWITGVVQGDWGRSLEWARPVSSLIKDRLPWSFAVSMLSFVFVWVLALPIGIYSATHQYTLPDYVATSLGFIGVAVPNFMIALLALWIFYNVRGEVIVGLFSPKYLMEPWSFAKFVDLLRHLWIPALILGTAGTAGTIRAVRANLLDELQKPYVMVARAKGVSERKVLFKYPLRIALIPTAATIGGLLPSLFGGELIVSQVLGIPTMGPLLFNAVRSQDMYLAGSIVLIISALSIFGNLISDILVGFVDPRIKGAV